VLWSRVRPGCRSGRRRSSCAANSGRLWLPPARSFQAARLRCRAMHPSACSSPAGDAQRPLLRSLPSGVMLDALVGPSWGKRPELADKPMFREDSLRPLQRERLEVRIESGCVPVAPEVIDSLRIHHRAGGIRRQQDPGSKARPRRSSHTKCGPERVQRSPSRSPRRGGPSRSRPNQAARRDDAGLRVSEGRRSRPPAGFTDDSSGENAFDGTSALVGQRQPKGCPVAPAC
jgi:hypothetical protein